MAMPARYGITTIEELPALPEDGWRHELLDGEHVVTPAPTYPHQHILSRLWEALRAAVGDHAELEVLTSPADIMLGPNTLVQPDVFIVRFDPVRGPRSWKSAGVPLLAVGILSPVTAARDWGTKRRLYLQAGVEEYWIVGLDARLIARLS